MNVNNRIPVFLTASLLFLAIFLSRAQDADQSTNAVADDDATNEVPLLKDLMTSNNIVTNTVGVVLVKVSPGFWAGKYEVTQDAYQKVMHKQSERVRRQTKSGGFGELE